MNINATLIGQAIWFALFVFFCMKFVWPPISRALDERKQKIAEGLSAADRQSVIWSWRRKRRPPISKNLKRRRPKLLIRPIAGLIRLWKRLKMQRAPKVSA